MDYEAKALALMALPGSSVHAIMQTPRLWRACLFCAEMADGGFLWTFQGNGETAEAAVEDLYARILAMGPGETVVTRPGGERREWNLVDGAWREAPRRAA